MRIAALAIGVLLLTACSSGSSRLSDDTDPPPASAAGKGNTPAAPTAAAATTSERPAQTTTAAGTAPPTLTSAPTSAPASTTATTPPKTVAELLALGRPVVLAHTGGEDEFPGSTMFGFAESVKAGVDMLDLNVMLSADGVLVVQHDDTVDRLTDSTGKVGEMTYADLAELDNAYWFTADGVGRNHPAEAYVYRGIRTGDKPPPPGYTADDFAIPRFSDLVARFPDALLNVEIEGDGAAGAAAATQLAQELRDLQREQASVVTSFDDATVDVFRALAPTVELTPGLGASAAWILSGTPLPNGMRILQLPPEFSGTKVLTPASIAASHAAGYLIWVWPNDRRRENAASYAEFLRDGVDGLNVNFPADGVAAVAAFTETLPTST